MSEFPLWSRACISLLVQYTFTLIYTASQTSTFDARFPVLLLNLAISVTITSPVFQDRPIWAAISASKIVVGPLFYPPNWNLGLTCFSEHETTAGLRATCVFLTSHSLTTHDKLAFLSCDSASVIPMQNAVNDSWLLTGLQPNAIIRHRMPAHFYRPTSPQTVSRLAESDYRHALNVA